jgi:hypothetical protein
VGTTDRNSDNQYSLVSEKEKISDTYPQKLVFFFFAGIWVGGTASETQRECCGGDFPGFFLTLFPEFFGVPRG